MLSLQIEQREQNIFKSCIKLQIEKSSWIRKKPKRKNLLWGKMLIFYKYIFETIKWYKLYHLYLHIHFTYINICLLLLLSRFSHVQLCATPQMAAYQAPPSLGFSRQEHWSGLPFPSPIHESEVTQLSDSQQPHGLQPTKLLHPWDLPGKSTGVAQYAINIKKNCICRISHIF